jgi:translation elongation factor EF-1alpha
MEKNKAKVSFVFFGPANVGKSTMIGYMQTYNLSDERFFNEINKIKRKLGIHYQKDRLFSYFVDDAKDEYSKNIEKSHGETKGTSKYSHITEMGEIFLIDTPGGNKYEGQRFKGISLANIGIFAIEIKQLLKLQKEYSKDNLNEYLKTVKEFFSSWYVWQKLHGTKNSIILLTKYDSFPSEDYYNEAKKVLENIIGVNVDVEVIPTSIDVNSENHSDINIFKKLEESWYKGRTLMQVIDEKFALISNSISQSDLLMFYNRKYDSVPGIGSIIKWKISSGILEIQNRLTIAPVVINNKYTKVNASIKSMHNEKDDNINSAQEGEIVNIALRNIVFDSTSIKRENVEVLNTSIIVSSEKSIVFGNILKVSIELSQCNKEELLILNSFKINSQVRILWFGKVLFPSIKSIEIFNDKVMVLILDLTNNLIDFPLNSQIALPSEDLPKKILLQNKPANPSDLFFNYNCIVTQIFQKE